MDTPAVRRVEDNVSRTSPGDRGLVPISTSRRKTAGRTARAASTGTQRNHRAGRFTRSGMAANTKTVRSIPIPFWYRSPRMTTPLKYRGGGKKGLPPRRYVHLVDHHPFPAPPAAPDFISPSPSIRGEDFH